MILDCQGILDCQCWLVLDCEGGFGGDDLRNNHLRNDGAKKRVELISRGQLRKVILLLEDWQELVGLGKVESSRIFQASVKAGEDGGLSGSQVFLGLLGESLPLFQLLLVGVLSLNAASPGQVTVGAAKLRHVEHGAGVALAGLPETADALTVLAAVPVSDGDVRVVPDAGVRVAALPGEGTEREPFLFLPQQSGFFFQLVFSSLVSALGPDPFHRVVWVRASSCSQVDDCASFAAPDGPEPVDTLEEA